MEPCMNEEAKMQRLPYMAHETSPGVVRSPMNRHRRSWQPIPAILIWPLARRESGWKRAGKKSQSITAIERTGIRLSVGRPDQDTLNNSSPRSNAGSDDGQPPCVFALRVECAPTLFPQRNVKRRWKQIYMLYIFDDYILKKEVHKLCFHVTIKVKSFVRNEWKN